MASIKNTSRGSVYELDRLTKCHRNGSVTELDEITAVLKGKGAHSQEIVRFARLYATYFYLDPLVFKLLFPVNHFCN